MVLHEMGPLKSKEIYEYYLFDEMARSCGYFKNLTHFRKEFITPLRKKKMIIPGGYNKEKLSFPGYYLNTKKAFERVIIFLNLILTNKEYNQ